MKRRIVFATGKENKMKEIRMILADLGMEIVSMREAGVDEEIVEDGMSFEENAEIKARAVSRVLVNDIVLICFSSEITFCVFITCDHVCRPAVKFPKALAKFTI